MLVLTRKVGESIAIGDDIKIIVMQIKGKQVRLGIKASENTVIHREEVYQKIQKENKAAAQSKISSLQEVSDLFNSRSQEPETEGHMVKLGGNAKKDEDE